jgi:hypothetical protein
MTGKALANTRRKSMPEVDRKFRQKESRKKASKPHKQPGFLEPIVEADTWT